MKARAHVRRLPKLIERIKALENAMNPPSNRHD
jgi:hypothetical protein